MINSLRARRGEELRRAKVLTRAAEEDKRDALNGVLRQRAVQRELLQGRSRVAHAATRRSLGPAGAAPAPTALVYSQLSALGSPLRAAEVSVRPREGGGVRVASLKTSTLHGIATDSGLQRWRRVLPGIPPQAVEEIVSQERVRTADRATRGTLRGFSTIAKLAQPPLYSPVESGFVPGPLGTSPRTSSTLSQVEEATGFGGRVHIASPRLRAHIVDLPHEDSWEDAAVGFEGAAGEVGPYAPPSERASQRERAAAGPLPLGAADAAVVLSVPREDPFPLPPPPLRIPPPSPSHS
jgi:hypothetical protein